MLGGRGIQRDGTETFVGLYNGAPGTFKTTYLFTATYTDCANLVGEIVGRCQHPIVAGSGEGVFEGVTGRFDFKDDIESGNFPYRGHFRWATSDLRASSSTAFSSGTLAASVACLDARSRVLRRGPGHTAAFRVLGRRLVQVEWQGHVHLLAEGLDRPT